ncbi:MAG: SDR family oxidoreductase [Thermodesulfobacteriota bacterium]|nr:SDR family oxidoreductase [Thermodesulfobacteriota bacterium]
MQSILITGSNRGLGLAWARQYAYDGWRVFATCRHPSEASELQELARQHETVSIHRLDVTVQENMRALRWEIEREPIDVLLSNAGVYLEKGQPQCGYLSYEDWTRTFEVNTLGAARLIETFVENVQMSRKRLVVAISSHMGSIVDIGSSGSYYYRSSKAALNAVMHGLAVELKPRGIGVLILHPGGVKTRMGPPHGISPEESVRNMKAVIERFTLEDTGRFVRYDGTDIPW